MTYEQHACCCITHTPCGPSQLATNLEGRPDSNHNHLTQVKGQPQSAIVCNAYSYSCILFHQFLGNVLVLVLKLETVKNTWGSAAHMHAEGRGRVLINLDFMCFQLNSTKNFSLRHSNVCQVNCRLKKPPHHPLRFENHFLCQLEEYLSHFYENNVVRILRNNFEIMFGFSARRSLNLLLFLFFLLLMLDKVCHL